MRIPTKPGHGPPALGEDLGSPRLRPGLAVAVDSGDLAAECACLEALLSRALLCDKPARRIEQGLRPVTFYLDVRSFPPWSPMAETRAGELVRQLGARNWHRRPLRETERRSISVAPEPRWGVRCSAEGARPLQS